MSRILRPKQIYQEKFNCGRTEYYAVHFRDPDFLSRSFLRPGPAMRRLTLTPTSPSLPREAYATVNTGTSS